MELVLNTKKQLTQTANEYFEQAKKLRAKAEGAAEAVATFKDQLAKLDTQQAIKEEKAKMKKQVPRKWYEKFRWFISSEGFLCIGGRDATSNEVVVKKHTDEGDIIFHTEAPGSPFFVIKAEGKEIGEQTLQEVADATASYSRAWKQGYGSVETYSVSPDQLSKTAESGEYMPKGGFMVRGKRDYRDGVVLLAVGILEDGRVMCAPLAAIKAHCEKSVAVKPGPNKTSDCAKKIAKKIGADVDDIVRLLPAGGCQL